jgi:Concanavalin A-like lectin/glucanases superfamily/F5/8 type C domain
MKQPSIPQRLGLILLSMAAACTAAQAAVTNVALYPLGETNSLAGADKLPRDTVGSSHFTNSSSGYLSVPFQTGAGQRSLTALNVAGGNIGFYGGGAARTDNFGFEISAAALINQNATLFTQGPNFFPWIFQANNRWAAAIAGHTYIGGDPATGGGAPVVLGQWTSLAMVKAGGQWSFYVDGVKVGGSVARAEGSQAGGQHLGVSPNGGGFFKGSLDQARVFTFAAGAFNPYTDLTIPLSVDKLRQSKYGIFCHYLNNPPPPAPGDPPPLPSVSVPSKPGGLGGGVWDATVNSFNIPTFVQQVKRTGAAYVVFTIGQTQLNFCSPNTALQQAGATALGNANYNSQGYGTSNRDLIGEIAYWLNLEGIDFYPYIPASSWYDYANGTGWVTPAIITEYSNRWGTTADGWWIDGCYPTLSGLFTNPALAQSSANTLINACRSGNPNSVVFCNSEANTWLIHSGNQGAIGGEEDFFHRLPDPAVPLTFTPDGRRMQWQLCAYLGSNWGSQDLVRHNAFNAPTYLPRYVKKTASLGGATTIDMAVTATGSLLENQMLVMDEVRNHVRGTSDFLTPVASVTPAINLALAKIAYLKSNDTQQNLEAGGTGVDGYYHQWKFWPIFGNNGKYDFTFAAPVNPTAWNYMVDLELSYAFNQVVVTFPAERYPTQFTIDTSANGTTWTTRATRTNSNGGTKTVNLSNVTARYVRVRALAAPTGPNLAGMAVVECEVFKK